MTNRERIQAIIHGRELDRVPFLQYNGLAAPNEEVWAALGRDKVGIVRWSRVHRLETPNCSGGSEDIGHEGHRAMRDTLVTPGGTLTQRRRFEPTYGTGSWHRHYVQQPEDYDRLLAFLEDTVVVEDREPLERARAELGDDGLPLVAVERTPYQQLWVQLSLIHI